MASKKKSKKQSKKKPLKPKSKKPSSGKARSKGSISTKGKKSPSLKRSSKAGLSKASYTLVTLHPKTRKVIKPRKGAQVFFAWKSPQGKLYPIESQYSQAYSVADAKGILAAFKAGSPEAYNVYKQLTTNVSKVVDKDGNAVTETRLDKKTGAVKTLYRWKLTGRALHKPQSTSIHSVTGFLTPLTRGFTPQVSKEIPTGHYVKIPITFGKEKRRYFTVGRFTGDSIRDAIKRVLPDTTPSQLARRRIKVLGVDGYIDAYRPDNPYAEETPDWEDRENWTRKIWKDSNIRRFHVGATVSSLMDFASRVATGFRHSFSGQGLRVTSLLSLEEAEARQRHIDETIFRMEEPVWPKIINHPEAGVRYKLNVKGKGGKDVPARKYFPMRYEADGESATDKAGSRYETVLVLTLSIKGF